MFYWKNLDNILDNELIGNYIEKTFFLLFAVKVELNMQFYGDFSPKWPHKELQLLALLHYQHLLTE